MKPLKPLNELLAAMSDPVDVGGDLEHIVRETACNDCEHSSRPDYLLRLLLLIDKARETGDYDGLGVIVSKAIEYAYSLTEHGKAGQGEYIESLFGPSEIKPCPLKSSNRSGLLTPLAVSGLQRMKRAGETLTYLSLTVMTSAAYRSDS